MYITSILKAALIGLYRMSTECCHNIIVKGNVCPLACGLLPLGRGLQGYYKNIIVGNSVYGSNYCSQECGQQKGECIHG